MQHLQVRRLESTDLEISLDEDISHAEKVIKNPALEVAKVLTSNADEDGSGTVSLNDTLTYTITATNSGNVTLNNVTVDDDLTGDNTVCEAVAPGASCELVANHVVAQGDVDTGLINNVGTADSDETEPVDDTRKR